MASSPIPQPQRLSDAAATRAQAQITSSLRLFGLHGNPEHAHHDERIWHPQVMRISALLGQGVDAFWHQVGTFQRLQTDNGRLAARRQQQSLAWMWERIDAGLKSRFKHHPQVKAALSALSEQVRSGQLAASVAAERLLALLEGQIASARGASQ